MFFWARIASHLARISMRHASSLRGREVRLRFHAERKGRGTGADDLKPLHASNEELHDQEGVDKVFLPRFVAQQEFVFPASGNGFDLRNPR